MNEYRTAGLIESACNILDMAKGTHPADYTSACGSMATAYAMVAIAEELTNIRTILEDFQIVEVDE